VAARFAAGRKFRVAGLVPACDDLGVEAKFALSLLGVLLVGALACDGEDAPPIVRVHDDIIANVPTTMASAQPQGNADLADASTASSYGAVDEAGYSAGYTTSPLEVCKQCACEAGTYCFGGGTGYTTFSGTCSNGSSFGIGCQPLPAACATKPDCDCVFDALKAVPCYLVCSGTSKLVAYCPTP